MHSSVPIRAGCERKETEDPQPDADSPRIGIPEATKADNADHGDDSQNDVGHCGRLLGGNARERDGTSSTLHSEPCTLYPVLCTHYGQPLVVPGV